MNVHTDTLLEILKYVLPAIVVLIATSVIVNRFLSRDTREKQIELMRDTQNTTISLRLQAYERLAIFIERIHPRNLIPRVYISGMNVRELQTALVVTINAEFEHNLSQQIYVSKNVWNTVRNAKEQEANMVNQIAQQLDGELPAKELHSRIIDYVVTTENDLPTEIALQIINDEAKQVLSYGSI